VETAAGIVQEAANPDANIIFGATVNKDYQDELRVTVIATGFDQSLNRNAFAPAAKAAAPEADDIDKPVAAAAKPAKPADISDIDEIFSIFKR